MACCNRPANRLIPLLLCALATGCGTTRWTDTTRTATEQLLISDAIDKSVQELNFRALAGKEIFFDDSFLKDVIDRAYLVSSLRQHLLASGCVLQEKRDEAEYIVEARAGTVGTDRHDLLYGFPAMNLGFVPVPGVPNSIPEIPFAKRTSQMGVAKVSVFAYHRESGRPVWQSGIVSRSSRAKDIWIMGAGPFQKGTIYDGTKFAGDKIRSPLMGDAPPAEHDSPGVALNDEHRFQFPKAASADEALARRDNVPMNPAPPPASSGAPPATGYPPGPYFPPQNSAPPPGYPGYSPPANYLPPPNYPPAQGYNQPPPGYAPPADPNLYGERYQPLPR